MSGKVPEMLDRIADIYEEEVDRSVANLSEALTPILTVFIGVIVGGLLLGLYLPVFSMGQHVMTG
jgi:type IV pilus assembly protein PilC